MRQRARIAELAWLGVVFDPAANAAGELLTSRPESRIAVLGCRRTKS